MHRRYICELSRTRWPAKPEKERGWEGFKMVQRADQEGAASGSRLSTMRLLRSTKREIASSHKRLKHILFHKDDLHYLNLNFSI